MTSRTRRNVWIYVDRAHHFYMLPTDSCVGDVLKHYKFEEELKVLKEELKVLKEELKVLKEKYDLDHPSILIYQENIVTLTKSLNSSSSSLPNVDSSKYEFSCSCSEEDISIDTQCSYLFDKGIGKDKNSAIHMIEKIPAPAAKRPRIFDTSFPEPPFNSHSPSELNRADLDKLNKSPPYYHWMALSLRDMFRRPRLDNTVTLDGVAIEVPTQALDRVCKQFLLLRDKCFRNEYDFTAQVNRYLDRFYFDDNHVAEGAVLAQYPLKFTQRGDSCIVLYDKNWTIKHPVLATNDSKLKAEDFSKAEDESRLITLSALFRSTSKFPFIFSFPLCVSQIKLEMHISVNKKLQHIDICTAPFHEIDKLRRFFIVTYAVVRWSCQNDQSRQSDLPMCVKPKKDLDLDERFPERDVFIKDLKVVYKFYLIDGPKKPNVAVMESLGMKDVKLEKISDEYLLLSYPYIDGGDKPNYIEQFEVIADQLAIIHRNGLVHGDVRVGNLIFGSKQDQAHLIDFDYVAKQGTDYPINYNHTLSERPPNLKKMEYDHDWYSLLYVMTAFFGGNVAKANIKNDELRKYRDENINIFLRLL